MLRQRYITLDSGDRASLSLDFTTGSLDSRITFSRPSLATMYDSTGKLTYAPNNLCLRSQDFGTTWAAGGSSASLDATTAPDGTNTADKLAEDTATSQHNFSQTQSVPLGAPLIFSCYFKAAERSFAWLYIASGTSCGRYFDLSNGTVTGSTVTGTPTFSTIESVGNGWYRAAIGFTAGSVSANIILGAAPAAGTISYTGSSGSGIYVWGAQLEAVTYQTSPRTYVATTSAAYYGPRFDYNPSTLAARGLLIEEARTNLLTYSDAFDNAAWSKLAASVTANSVTAPDGTTSADTLTADGTSAAHYIHPGTRTWTATAHTLSAYMKQGTNRYGWLGAYDGTTNFGGVFDLQNGVYVGDRTGGGTTTASISSVGNGWYRCAVTFTPVAAATNFSTQIGTNNSGSLGLSDASTGTIYIWGAQLEAGSFATSYTATGSSSVARSASAVSATSTNFSSWWSANEGTIFAEFESAASGTRTIFAADDNTANNAVILYTSGTDLKFKVVSGGVTQCDITAGTIAANTSYKVAARYKADDFAVIMTGGVAQTDTSGSIPTVDRARFGSSQAGEYLCGREKTFRYYARGLNNTQLAALVA